MANRTNLTTFGDFTINNITDTFIFNDTTETLDVTESTYYDSQDVTLSTVPSPEIWPTSNQVYLRGDSWVIPLLALSSINLVAIACFEVYVLYKSCGSRRHLFLGQMLLLGLFMCSLMGYAFTLTPHWLICGLTRAGLGLAYVLVFATLLVKCLFLLGLHNGLYLNSAYQSLLIFFAFGIQVAISSQWLAYRTPSVITSNLVPQTEVCKIPPLERIQYLSYAMILLFMVCIGAIRGRSLKENNNEARYIGVSVGILVVIWVSWVAVLVIFERRYEDAAQGFGLVCSSIVVFLLVFVPKAVQLSMACRKNGSTNGSQSMVYAPSFLHLQPHAVLPSYADGASTLVKQQSAAADFCRGYASRFWRYDYPTFYQMEPQGLCNSDRSSQRKSNVTIVHAPLY